MDSRRGYEPPKRKEDRKILPYLLAGVLVGAGVIATNQKSIRDYVGQFFNSQNNSFEESARDIAQRTSDLFVEDIPVSTLSELVKDSSGKLEYQPYVTYQRRDVNGDGFADIFIAYDYKSPNALAPMGREEFLNLLESPPRPGEKGLYLIRLPEISNREVITYLTKKGVNPAYFENISEMPSEEVETFVKYDTDTPSIRRILDSKRKSNN